MATRGEHELSGSGGGSAVADDNNYGWWLLFLSCGTMKS